MLLNSSGIRVFSGIRDRRAIRTGDSSAAVTVQQFAAVQNALGIMNSMPLCAHSAKLSWCPISLGSPAGSFRL